MATSKQYPSEQVGQILLCELCYTEEDVNWFCKNCLKNICDNCKILHSRIPSLQLHDIGSIGDGKLFRETKQLCKQHGEIMLYLCLTCSSEEICLKCAGGDHQQHELLDIIQTAEETKKDIRDLLDEKSAYLSGLTKVRIMIDQKREESGRNIEKARKLINGRFATITKIKDDLIIALNAHENRMNLQLSNEEGVLENMQSKMRSEIESVRYTLDTPMATEVQKFAMDVRGRLNNIVLPSLLQLPCPSVFSENSDINLTSEYLFGKLKPQQTTKVDVLAIADPKGKHVIAYMHDLRILSKVQHKEPDFKFIFDILTTTDGRAWVTMKKNRLQMIDEEGNVHKCITLPAIPSHLAQGPNEELLVSYGRHHIAGNDVIKIIHNDDSHSDFMELSQYRFVYGLLCAKNLSVICIVVDDKDNHFVIKKSQKGETKWKLSLEGLKSYKLFVRKDQHGNFYFKTKSGLRFVNEKGRTVRQANLGLDIKDVGPVENDKLHNFIVGTRDGKIFLYDKYFQVQRRYNFQEEHSQIYALAIGDDDKLWISTFSGYIYVTKYFD